MHIQRGGLKEITFLAGWGQSEKMIAYFSNYTLITHQIYDDTLLYHTFQTDKLIFKFFFILKSNGSNTKD